MDEKILVLCFKAILESHYELMKLANDDIELAEKTEERQFNRVLLFKKYLQSIDKCQDFLDWMESEEDADIDVNKADLIDFMTD